MAARISMRHIGKQPILNACLNSLGLQKSPQITNAHVVEQVAEDIQTNIEEQDTEDSTTTFDQNI